MRKEGTKNTGYQGGRNGRKRKERERERMRGETARE